MLSKGKIKLIKSLNQKKYRSETRFFLAEGNKLVADLLPFFDCELLVYTESWLSSQPEKVNAKECILAEQEEIDKASLLKNPQQVIALFRQARPLLPSPKELQEKLSLVLDGIQDPGNLGTIIRLADWFGIENIFCSQDTADVYNPKTVQATMGALSRVNIHYVNLAIFLNDQLNTFPIPVYGTFLDGEDMYRTGLTSTGFIVMGNEGNGVSEEIKRLVSHKLYIPNFPAERKTSESLNVAIATSIVCAEFRRRQIHSI